MMDKSEFFTAVLLIAGPRPPLLTDDYNTSVESLSDWCNKVEGLMMSDAAKEVKWTHQLTSVPWRLRRSEFERWIRRQEDDG